MSASAFYVFGFVFLALFILTLIWEVLSLFSKGKAPQPEKVIVEQSQEEWDPFKHLLAPEKNPNKSGGEIHVEVPPYSPQNREPLGALPPKMETPAPASPPPPAGKEQQPEPAEPAMPNVGLDDPWKSLMQESAKPREISLEFDNKLKEDENK